MVAGGQAGPVAEFLDDGQGGLVALFGGVVVAADSGEDPELEVDGGGVAGAGRDPAECFVPQLAFGGPCSPGPQLAAGFLVGVEGVVEVAGGVVVVAGLQQLLDVLGAGLRPDRYPPPPVGRRPAVRGDQAVRAGAVLERCGGPPVHHQSGVSPGTGGFRGGGRGDQAQPGQQAQRPAALSGERDRRAGQLGHVAVVPVQRLGVQAEVFG